MLFVFVQYWFLQENRYNCDNFENFSKKGFMLQVQGGEMINKRRVIKAQKKAQAHYGEGSNG